jgi:hypothetical protein
MNRRGDDMVLGLDLQAPGAEDGAPARADERHRMVAQTRALRLLVEAGARRRVMRAMARKTEALAVRSVVATGVEAGGAVARGARAINPIGLIVGVLLVAGVATLRLASGKPLEGTGEMINRWIWGGLDSEARGRAATLMEMEDDSTLARVAANTMSGGRTNQQLQTVFDARSKRAIELEKARRLFSEAFPANSTLDMLILRVRDAWVSWWATNGGDAKVDDVGRALAHTQTKGR